MTGGVRASGILLGLAALAGPADAQRDSLPTLLVAPFVSGVGRNLASDLWDDMRAGIERLGVYEQVAWEVLLDASPLTREMSEERRAGLNCIGARQLATREGVDYVLCGMVRADRDGIRLELRVIENQTGEATRLCSAASRERQAVATDALAQFGEWSVDRAPGEEPRLSFRPPDSWCGQGRGSRRTVHRLTHG